MAPLKATSYYRRGKASALLPDSRSGDEYEYESGEDEEADEEDQDIQVKPRKARKPPKPRVAANSQSVNTPVITINGTDMDNSVASGSEAALVPVRSIGKYQPGGGVPGGVSGPVEKPIGKSKKAAPQPPQTRKDLQIIHTSGMYKIKDILDETEQDGRVMYLMDWHPTWESAADAKPTKKLLDAWDKIKAARDREEQEDTNHTLLTFVSQEKKRRQKDYRDKRDRGLAKISHMTKNSSFSSTEAVEWFRIFQDLILDELEVFLFNITGLKNNHGSGSTVIFPMSTHLTGNIETRDKYALWLSDTTSLTIPAGSVNNPEAGRSDIRDSDTEMQGQDTDREAVNDKNKEILLTIIPNPYYDGAIPTHMPCGALYIRDVPNLRKAADYFSKHKSRPPVRQLYDMMLETFGTVVRLAPRLKVHPKGGVTVQTDDQGGYEFVAREVTLTHKDNKYAFEWLVVREELKHTAKATRQPPAPKPSTASGPSVPGAIRDFKGLEGNTRGRANTDSAGSSSRHHPSAKPGPSGSNTHDRRTSLPNQPNQTDPRRLAGTPVPSAAPMPAKRKSPTTQTHGRKATTKPGVYIGPALSDESGGENTQTGNNTSVGDGPASDGDQMDIDEAVPTPMPRRDSLNGLSVGAPRSRQTSLNPALRLSQLSREGSVGGSGIKRSNKNWGPASVRARADKGKGKAVE